MNKTLDINIANQIFHIDENAYRVLKNYLDAIQKSLANEVSREEIIQDIEARIAELFIERMISDNQVISVEDVNAVIKIMGEPEDYHLSDEDETASKTSYKSSKKLYRDKESSYISGLSAGVGHYLNINPIWIRLLWILFTVFSTGWFILIYIILWIIVPEARTTAEKLAMKGEPINLSNIEKKIKEGYENVSEKLKDVDVEKHSKNAQSAISSFFDGLEKVLRTLGRFAVKFIGIILVLASGLGIVGLIIATLSISGLGFFSDINYVGFEFAEVFRFINPVFPIWAIITSIFVFSIVPLILFFILGIKILFPNTGNASAALLIPLIAFWIISIVMMILIGISSSYNDRTLGEVVVTNEVSVSSNDTLLVKMNGNLNYISTPFVQNMERITYSEEDKRVLYDSNVDVKFNHTSENRAYVRISKFAYDFGEDNARNKADQIVYEYNILNNVLSFDSFMLAEPEFKNNSIGVDIDIYIPETVVISIDENVDDFLENRFENRSIENRYEKFYKFSDNELVCLDCNEKIIEEQGNQTK
jgi:phage shock protein PspC (stress-responsive transcriptional regulator)